MTRECQTNKKKAKVYGVYGGTGTMYDCLMIGLS